MNISLKIVIFLVVNYVNKEPTTRKRIRPNLTNHKTTDTDTGLIVNKYKDQDTDQTEYKDETTTIRVFDYERDTFKRDPEESDVKIESSFVNNDINTVTPGNANEDTTAINYESDEKFIATSENVTPVSIKIYLIRSIPVLT